MHIEEPTPATTMENTDSKLSASSEIEDDEILQLKKALLIDNSVDIAPPEKKFAPPPNFVMDSRPFIPSHMSSAPTKSSPLSMHNFYPFPDAMSNAQPYPEYALRSVGSINFKPSGLPANFQASSGGINPNRPAARFDLPQGINYSGVQQRPLLRPPPVPPHLGQYTMPTRNGSPLASYPMVARPVAFHSTGPISEVCSNSSGPGIALHNDASIAALKSSNSGDVNTQVAPPLPKDADQENQKGSLIFNDKPFREGDFVILKNASQGPSGPERIIVQIFKFMPSKHGVFQGFHYMQPNYLDIEPAKNFYPQELIRLPAKGRYNLADFEERCQVVSEEGFILSLQDYQSQPTFVVRFRYIEKKRTVFKIKNISAVLNINQPPEPVQAMEFKAPAPPGCSNILCQPELSSPSMRRRIPKIATTSIKATNYRLKRKDADYIDSLKNEYPCDPDRNLLWFSTPPIYPPRKVQDIGLSLDFLVHLAKKRKASQA